jgi:uncharacterized protein (DUF1810 family)
MRDPYNLQRFVDAQNPEFDDVLPELRSGYKTGHWMWFIFPQIKGLGHSNLAAKFGISGRQEARAYLDHPILGPRLKECTALVVQCKARSIKEIFDPPDDLKFRSSMTLFDIIAPGGEFSAALKKFNTRHDQATIDGLKS